MSGVSAHPAGFSGWAEPPNLPQGVTVKLVGLDAEPLAVTT
jgi:hypothetical protein